MKEYKRHLYTEEELKALFQWFDNQDLPANMQLDKSTYIPDLQTTLKYLKLQAENYVRAQRAFPYVILRPTGVYGPGERDYFLEIQSVQSGFDFTVGRKPQQITFIYVKDLARVALDALERKEIINKEYFVADGDVHTDASFSRLIQELLQKKHVLHARIPLPFVYLGCLISEQIGKLLHKGMTLNNDKYKILKQRNWICDIHPLQEDLGFRAEYPLRKGLEESIAWYKQHKWLP